MHSAKEGVVRLADIFGKMGVNRIVFSPGSRNAPLVIEFANRPEFECFVIPDERVAAFYALGLSIGSGDPVAICSTSGSAPLNYAPAIAEAYYQRIPLIAMTADRPSELVDQADGQTIRQNQVYSNIIKCSYELSDDITSMGDPDQIIDAIRTATGHHPGPVHLNIPLTEPLYDTTDQGVDDIAIAPLEQDAAYTLSKDVIRKWQDAKKKLILVGQHDPDETLAHLLEQIAMDPTVAVVIENTSNVYSPKFNSCIDRLITSFNEEEMDSFTPDILLTLGETIISKKIKSMFRNQQPTEHWNVDPTIERPDTYGALTKDLPNSFNDLLRQLMENSAPGEGNYGAMWKQRDLETAQKHAEFLSKAPYSDLKVFEILLDKLPNDSDLHLSNSTPIRYAQLFNNQRDLRYYCNRGVSGIDGCTSTAAGAAHATGRLTTLITGDMAFLYDSNAFWNDGLGDNLRIVVINNGGGGIFRIIPGPSSTPQLEQYFEAHHRIDGEHICKAFDINYHKAHATTDLEEAISKLYGPSANGRPTVLEIFTPRETNDEVLRDYFNFIAS